MKLTTLLNAALFTLICTVSAAQAGASFDATEIKCIMRTTKASCNNDLTVGNNGCFNSVVCKSTAEYLTYKGEFGSHTFKGTACYFSSFSSPMKDALSNLEFEMEDIDALPMCY